jgi:ABC-type lipoprotein release transport system permease subunit
VAGLSKAYESRASDHVRFRQVAVDIIGVEGDLSKVLYADLMEFTAGGQAALDKLQTEPNAVVISEGLAAHLAVGLGETIVLYGEGIDHDEKATIVGIARRIPGVDGITRSRIAAQNHSTVLVSLPFYSQLVTEVDDTPPGLNDPLIVQVKATYDETAAPDIGDKIYDEFGKEQQFWVQTLAWEIEESQSELMFFVILLLAMTGISFTTAVFAVFAVIYVTIYARRIEIGMLKSMGMLRRQLTGMLTLEAIAMTLGAALAGIAAGAIMGYLSFYINAVLEQRPAIFTFDKIAMPAIIVMVVLASILAAAFSARRIVRKPAVEILRMS